MALSADMNVLPSGLAVDTAWAPMLMEAPRLSTMICWPSVWSTASATVLPPVGYGATQRKGRSVQEA